jgi:hypothetical protein
VCSSVRDKATFVTDPVVVFEIISPRTSGVDRITKNQEYRDTTSIKLYVILKQDCQAAAALRRDHGDWAGHVFSGETGWECRKLGFRCPWQNSMPEWSWWWIRRPEHSHKCSSARARSHPPVHCAALHHLASRSHETPVPYGRCLMAGALWIVFRFRLLPGAGWAAHGVLVWT